MPARTARKSTSKSKARPASARPTQLAALSSRELIDRLAEVARIGALFIEGEDCENLLVPEARQWTDPDDINFDAKVAVGVKKTLLRIERIERFPYHAIIWRRRPDDPDRGEIMLAGSMSSSYSLGKKVNPPLLPELRRVFETGRPAVRRGRNEDWESVTQFRYGHVWLMAHDSLLRAGRRLISHFSPIRDSRDKVVAALELTCVGTDS
ncbi:MAG: hypothetical protein BIFFINMI_01529 [Phycisphaerae bacterium]|nr:hypothetical protein [Phycisphaerae bacterium]